MAKDESGYRQMFTKPNLHRDNPQLLPNPAKTKSGLQYKRGMGLGSGAYPRYRTPEAIQYAIEEYFQLKTLQEKPPTLPGLALALGFKSTQTLKDYENKGEEYAYYIEVARTRVEEWKNELLLLGGNHTQGVIFDLKNHHGYSDKIEQKTTLTTEGSLAELLQALQGQVLRPALFSRNPEPEDAKFTELSPSEPDFDDLLGGIIPENYDDILG